MNSKELTTEKRRRPRIKQYQHQDWTPGQLAIMEEERLHRESVMHKLEIDPGMERDDKK